MSGTEQVSRWVCERCFQLFMDSRQRNFVCAECSGRSVDQQALLRLINIRMVAEEVLDIAEHPTGALNRTLPADERQRRMQATLDDIVAQLRFVLRTR